jgi:hypothetical protein
VEQTAFWQWLLERFGFPVGLVVCLLWRDYKVLFPLVQTLREVKDRVEGCPAREK